jgi:AcrR family transcriptional regulator
MRDQGPKAGRGSTERRDDERATMLGAVLSLSGELGYREATVERVAERSGHPVGAFYSLFSGREECFALAYELKAEELLARILAAAADEGHGCRGRVEAALVELVSFATTEETIARAVIAEVYVAGGAALEEHKAVLERLSRAVADACRETHPSRHNSPSAAVATAEFIAGGVEESIRRRLVERRPALLWDDLPELSAFVLGPYED